MTSSPNTLEDGWQDIATAPGDHKSGPFLVTNNLYARDAHGQMSHIWLVRAVYRVGRDFDAFTSGNEQIRFLTHWMPLPAPPEPGK